MKGKNYRFSRHPPIPSFFQEIRIFPENFSELQNLFGPLRCHLNKNQTRPRWHEIGIFNMHFKMTKTVSFQFLAVK